MKIKRLLISLVAGLGLTLALIWLLVGLSPPARAQGPDGYSIYYVAPEGVDCGITPCYTNVQAAVDATDDPSDVVKVAAGTYTDTHSRPRRDITSAGLTTQVVYISETVTIRGGYTTTNGFADPPDPKANPTTLNAQEDGRVIYVTGDINAILAGLRIINGRAAGLGGGPQGHDAGGGVYVITAALALSDSQVFGNTANRGGGLYLLNSEAVFIANTVISNNIAYTVGGGLRLAGSSARLSGNDIFSNSADTGGGLHLGVSTATLNGNRIFSNTAYDGGGLYLLTSTATLSDNWITSNTTSYVGGGLRLASDSAATLSGDVITANSASTSGAGLLVANRSAATMTNSIIADNVLTAPKGMGAGLHVTGSSARMLHCTIARNTGGDGSGIYVGDKDGIHSAVALTNTILVSHTVDISVTGGNTVTVNGVLGTPLTISQSITATPPVTVRNEHKGDPAFVNPDAGDYHIGPTSEARDVGEENVGVSLDWDGEVRPVGPRPDLGADEFLATLSLAKQASPDPVQAGEQLTYTVRITNASHIGLHATITDTLPDHVTPGGTLTWTPDPISPDEVWTQPVVVTVERGYAGLLTNTVEVTTQEGATGLYTQVITSVVIPALSLVKEASPTTANVGETITYTYTVENIGSAILTTVSVTDDHLRGIGLVTTTLAPHDITTGTATYVVQQSDLPGPLVNVVTVTCTPPMGNPITATASVTLTSHPAIRVAKDANVSAARVGETITYRYTITNTGDVTLTDIRASDNRLGPIRLGADSLPPAAVTTGSATYTLVKADRPGPIINTVTVTGASPTGLVSASASDNVAIPLCWQPAGAVLLVALISYVLRRNTSQPRAL